MNCDFEKIIGSVLLKAIGALHYFEGSFATVPEYLTLKFEGKGALTISCEADGERIQVNRELIEPIDMQESGEMVLCDLTRKSPFSKFFGKPVVQIFELISINANKLIGLRLEFIHQSSLVVLNWGDELLISDQFPQNAVDVINREFFERLPII